MPYIKRTRKPLRRRRPTTMRRKRPMFRRRPRTNALMVRSRNIIPKRMFVKLPYSTEHLGFVTSSTIYSHQFRVNSIFDPDYTYTGHQPKGHDQYEGLYRSYRVHGVLVEAWSSTTSGSGTLAGQSSFISIYPHKSTTVPTSTVEVFESPDTKHRTFDATNPVYIKKYISCARVFGQRKSVYNTDVDYQALFGANPTNVAYVTVQVCNVDQSTSTGFFLRVKLTYYVELNDPLQLGQS